jgi:two-component system OmpR family sensor kinase
VAIRTRILFVVVALVLVALGLLDVVSYTVVRRSLISRADTQLEAAAPTFQQTLNNIMYTEGPGAPASSQNELCNGLPVHSFGAIYKTTGGSPIVYNKCYSAAPPKLSSTIAATAPGASAPSPSFASLGSFRIALQRVPITPRGNPSDVIGYVVLVVGEPLAPVNSTLGNILILELVVTGSILIGTGAAAFFLVQLGLRPLEQMSETAGEIAAGDLSRRIEETDQRTEVGRLGSSLNIMLTRIESAFQAKEISEVQLRQFVADASHELRTPLTSIRGYAELFRTGVVARPEEVSTAMERIERESQRMSVLVEDLLLLARLDQGRPLDRLPVDLLQLARTAAADIRVVAPGREIQVLEAAVSQGTSYVVSGDEQRLSQVFVNLLSNAVAHTPEPTPIELVLAGTESTVRIEVVDHGPGIPVEDRPRVFDRFWRADESRQRRKGGTGLGLSIVAAVVAAHGGTVLVWETEGGGATFGVELPRSDLLATAGAEIEPEQPAESELALFSPVPPERQE